MIDKLLKKASVFGKKKKKKGNEDVMKKRRSACQSLKEIRLFIYTLKEIGSA